MSYVTLCKIEVSYVAARKRSESRRHRRVGPWPLLAPAWLSAGAETFSRCGLGGRRRPAVYPRCEEWVRHRPTHPHPRRPDRNQDCARARVRTAGHRPSQRQRRSQRHRRAALYLHHATKGTLRVGQVKRTDVPSGNRTAGPVSDGLSRCKLPRLPPTALTALNLTLPLPH